MNVYFAYSIVKRWVMYNRLLTIPVFRQLLDDEHIAMPHVKRQDEHKKRHIPSASL